MPSLRSPIRTFLPSRAAVAIVGFGFVFAACLDVDGPTSVPLEPEPETPITDPGLATLTSATTTGGVRVEVELRAEGSAWVAREVEVLTAADLATWERIESRVAAVDEEAGTVTLQLGGLAIQVGDGARFESAGRTITRRELFEGLARRLAAGGAPGVELRRAAVSPAQAPDASGFDPEIVILDLDGGDPVLDLNIDDRHLRADGADGGTLTFLGVAVGVRASSSVVERSSAQAGAVDLEGLAASVDEAGAAVTLADGTVVRLLEGTRIRTGGDRLGSLADVATALGEGTPVLVDAEGVLESEGVYVAIKVAFDPQTGSGDDDGDDGEDGEGGDDEEEEGTQFGGNVVSVDEEAGTFTMTTGRVLNVGDDTSFDEAGDLLTLEAMAGAVGAGDRVMAEGRAVEDAESGAWVVLEVRVETSGEDGAFGGRVASVDSEAGTFTLMSGKVLTVGEDTAFDEEGDLVNLEAMQGALDAGVVVTVEGLAQKDAETGAWMVLEITVQASGSDGDFGGRVASVDLEAGTFTLMSGKVFTVGEDTAFDEEGALVSLEAMQGALDAGDVVTVEGVAERDAETGAWMVLEVTVQTSGEDGEFGGRVASVDLEAGTFTLMSGKVLTVNEETVFDEDGDLTSLEAMQGALDAGDVVTVEGLVEKDAETGAWRVTDLLVQANGEDGAFGGPVASVDLEAGTFSLKNGRVITVTGDTAFDLDGDYASLSEIADALDAGTKVKVSGLVARDAETGAWVATELSAHRVGKP